MENNGLNKYVFTKEIYAENWEKAYKTMAEIISFRTDVESVKELFQVSEVSDGPWVK